MIMGAPYYSLIARAEELAAEAFDNGTDDVREWIEQTACVDHQPAMVACIAAAARYTAHPTPRNALDVGMYSAALRRLYVSERRPDYDIQAEREL